MFELSVACKYLVPRWRQLSVSIISLVSTLVIALVVWLIVVFFSVKDGLENSWIDKIIALTAPVRITPTEKYYQSYYYLSDSVSANSDYTSKSIGEKLHAALTDPYDPETDEEPPANWPAPDRSQGELKDLVKQAYTAAATLPGIKGLKVSDYETTIANMRIRLLRNAGTQGHSSQQFLEHAAYVGSFDNDTRTIATALYPLSTADFTNLLHMQAVGNDNIKEDSPDSILRIEGEALHKRLHSFFEQIDVTALRAPTNGWRIPPSLYPESAHFEAAAVLKDKKITRLVVPANTKDLPNLLQSLKNEGTSVVAAHVMLDKGKITATLLNEESQPLGSLVPIQLAAGTLIKTTLIENTWKHAITPADLRFTVHDEIQGMPIKGDVILGKLEIAAAKMHNEGQLTVAARHGEGNRGIDLPSDPTIGEAILLPKSFREAGALVGDHGFLSYYSPTPSTVQEQRIPVFVAGFYDPGIIPIGGKYILASRALTASQAISRRASPPASRSRSESSRPVSARTSCGPLLQSRTNSRSYQPLSIITLAIPSASAPSVPGRTRSHRSALPASPT